MLLVFVLLIVIGVALIVYGICLPSGNSKPRKRDEGPRVEVVYKVPSYPSRYCKAKCASLRVPATHGLSNYLKIFMYFIHLESSDIVENGGANLPAAGEILSRPDFIICRLRNRAKI